MPSGLIFITGATGFIGSATAFEAVKAGYRLRISVRKEAQIPKLKAFLSEYEDKIEFVVIPDITQESSFDGKLDGVDYVLHLASPLPRGTDKEAYFGPSAKGTTAVLKEAAKVSSVKKVVITSSIAALIPRTGVPVGGVVKEDNGWDLTVDPTADFGSATDPGTPMRLYHASKLLANNASWDFKATEKPGFALVTLHPAFVYGHNYLQTTAEELKGTTNELFFGTIRAGVPMGNVTSVHIKDVAEAHVKALDDKIADGSKYLLAGGKAAWRDVAAIVEKEYADHEFKINESIPGESWAVDTTKAETDLGIKWRSLEQIVKEVVDQQVGFIRQAKA